MEKNKNKKEAQKEKVREEIGEEFAVRKEDLNRVRGAQNFVDPERGPENKKKNRVGGR